jgi:hypothetical protein
MMNLFGRYRRTKSISKNDLANVLHFVKKKMAYEPDEFKKQAWAEVGIELNRIYLHLGVTTNHHVG